MLLTPKIGEVKGRGLTVKTIGEVKGPGGWSQWTYRIIRICEDCLSSSAIFGALKLKLKSSAVGMEP